MSTTELPPKMDQETASISVLEKGEKYKRQPLRLTGLKLFGLAFSTLGIIYSDIGLTLVQVLFALEFGTGEGEGGPFALFMSLFPRHDPEDRSLTKYSTYDYRGHRPEGRSLTQWRWPLLIWTLFGTALTLSDGVLTPAVSVTSAVGGIAVVKPSVLNAVVGISIAFLVLLFGVQRFGTGRLSFTFAPITAVWLALLGATGIYNMVAYPGIWRAYDPSRAVALPSKPVLRSALTSSLGQFNKASIRFAFAGYVYPMLIGQGARLIQDPTAVSNIFYRTIPGPTGGPLYWIVFVFAILATLIASQAMITATFSLIHQLVAMKAFPAIRIRHTSTMTYGQVYIDTINWSLMIGTVAVFAVATVMFVTTTLIALSIPVVKGLPWVLGVAFFLLFGFFDGLFWGASLKKVPHGAWFPLGLGGLMFENVNSSRLSQLVTVNTEEEPSKGLQLHPSPSAPVQLSVPVVYLNEADGGKQTLPRVKTFAVYHRSTSAGQGVPHAFASFLRNYPALPDVVVFLSTQVAGLPHVPPTDRYSVCKVRVGYMDPVSPVVDDLLPILESIVSPVGAVNGTQVRLMYEAAKNVTHFIPSYNIRSRPTSNRFTAWLRRLLLEEVYARARVCFPERVVLQDQAADK
ncbi:hypothetical protein IAU60_001908 [Kwoniella sp. DSM 27419]